VPRLRGAIEITEADSAYSSQLRADACRRHYGLDDEGVRYCWCTATPTWSTVRKTRASRTRLCKTREDQDEGAGQRHARHTQRAGVCGSRSASSNA